MSLSSNRRSRLSILFALLLVQATLHSNNRCCWAWTASRPAAQRAAKAAKEIASLSSSRTRSSSSSLSRRTWMERAASQLVVVASAAAATATAAVPQQVVAAQVIPKSVSSVCDATVSVWRQAAPSSSNSKTERLVYLLGTAHISSVSAQLAGSLVRDVHPNAVFVELDLKRVASVLGGNGDNTLDEADLSRAKIVVPNLATTEAQAAPIILSAAGTTSSRSSGTSSSQQQLQQGDAAADAITAPRPNKQPGWFQKQTMNFAAQAVGKAIQGMYSDLDTQGFKPGDEFVTAVREGQLIGATTVLGDQDVQVTLQRLTQALAVTDLSPLLRPDSDFEKTMTSLAGAPPQQQPNGNAVPAVTAEYVEQLKERSTVRQVMAELQQVAPALVQVMLTERDAYMARGLDTVSNEFETIVAVMGMAHQDGVEENLRARGWTQVTALPQCPPPRP